MPFWHLFRVIHAQSHAKGFVVPVILKYLVLLTKWLDLGKSLQIEFENTIQIQFKAEHFIHVCLQSDTFTTFFFFLSSCWAPGRTRRVYWLYWSYLFEGLIDQHPYSSIISRPFLLKGECLIAPTIFSGRSTYVPVLPSLNLCMYVCGECWRVWRVFLCIYIYQMIFPFIKPFHKFSNMTHVT